MKFKGTAIGFSDLSKIKSFERTGLAGIALTAMGLVLTAVSCNNYKHGTAWLVTSEDDLEGRKYVVETCEDMKNKWGIEE